MSRSRQAIAASCRRGSGDHLRWGQSPIGPCDLGLWFPGPKIRTWSTRQESEIRKILLVEVHGSQISKRDLEHPPAHRDKTAMNGAQLPMTHGDSSGLMSGPPATASHGS
jgi:hypothetical protein